MYVDNRMDRVKRIVRIDGSIAAASFAKLNRMRRTPFAFSVLLVFDSGYS